MSEEVIKMKSEKEDGETDNSSKSYSKLIVHKSFSSTVEEINRLNIKIPPKPTTEEIDFQSYNYPNNGNTISKVEKLLKYKLDPERGQKLVNFNVPICAYDESLNKFSGLQGTAFTVSHSLVILGKGDYINSSFVTFYFYTRSEEYTKNSKYIKFSKDPEVDSNLDYIKDRKKFMLDTVPKNSIIFIDGPLIGGDVSSYTIDLNSELLKKDVTPIFFVKNSTSNLVTDYVKELTGKYNSDMHWAHTILKPGERTGFFKYYDKKNPKNAKIFCYMKAFNISPQRIEFDVNTFGKNEKNILEIMDIIYYLMLVQGDLRNPQVRPVAIAEKYARSTLKLFNLSNIMKEVGIASTMNQERFGWG